MRRPWLCLMVGSLQTVRPMLPGVRTRLAQPHTEASVDGSYPTRDQPILQVTRDASCNCNVTMCTPSQMPQLRGNYGERI